jgi:acyl transferase domain-containing protein/acyl carrier protein
MTGGHGPDRDEALLGQLRGAPALTRRRLVLDWLAREIATFLPLPAGEHPGPGSGFLELGFDSLRAVDFKLRLEERLGCSLPSTVLFDCPTPGHLADALLEALGHGAAPAPVVVVSADDDVPSDRATLAALPHDELVALAARTGTRLAALTQALHEPIAIVGTACRFPGGAQDPESFWRLQVDGVDAIEEVPADRWDVDAVYDPDPSAPGKMYSRWGGFLRDIKAFDHGLFGISPREAQQLDPNQRILLELTWEALERGGIAPDSLHGAPVGVWVGTRGAEYFEGQGDRSLADAETYYATGNSLSTMAGRISYVLGFTGPCFALDTACSSSLVAVHEAVQSLRHGTSEVAIAAGINTLLDPFGTISICKASMLSRDGRCKTFDASADGYVRSEGCGVLVMKRLSRALADGDRVLATIRGTAINQDGASGGLTVPSGPAQEAVLRAALADGRVDPADVSYMEAHGTGTSLGDPIEVAALDAVFGESHGPGGLLTGSVKTNIGHLETAAGMAGLFKVLGALQHGAIPPHLHLAEPNPHIPWDRTVVSVPDALRPWRRGERARLAGVSSFGFSGTNAHVVLEEAPPPAAERGTPPPAGGLLRLSARDEPSLTALMAHTAEALAGLTDEELPHLCASAATGRAELPWRVAVAADDADALRAGLAAAAPVRAPAQAPRLAFLYTGQGSQHPGMARGLFAAEPVFRDALQRCDEQLTPLLGRSLLPIMLGTGTEALLDRTDFTQPALFAVQHALTELLASWGLVPDVVAGHSVGEIAAAACAGVLDAADGASLAAARGRLMLEACEPGAMLAVAADQSDVADVLAEHGDALALATLNGPRAVVLAGTHAAVEAADASLSGRGLRTTRLSVSHAFHSPLMEPMQRPFGEVLDGLSFHAPRLSFASSLEYAADPASRDYWLRHVREPVRFAETASRLLADGPTLFLELGPKPILSGLLKGADGSLDGHAVLPCLRAGRDDVAVLRSALAELHRLGRDVDWRGVHAPFAWRRVDLPTYPFRRDEHWLERRGLGDGSLASGHPLLGAPVEASVLADDEHLFGATLSERSPAWLADHKAYDVTLLPAAGLVEMALAAHTLADARASGMPCALHDLAITAPLLLDVQPTHVQLLLGAEQGGRRAVSVRARAAGDDGAWTEHARGQVGPAPGAADEPELEPLADIEARCAEAVDVAAYYESYADVGLPYGPRFRSLSALARGDGEALGRIAIPGEADDLGEHVLHPILLDGAFQSCRTLTLQRGLTGNFLPLGLGRLVRHDALPREVTCHVTLVSASDDQRLLVFDLVLRDPDDGRLLAQVDGLQLVQAERASLAGAAATRGLLHGLRAVPLSPPAEAAGPERVLVITDRAGVGEALAAARAGTTTLLCADEMTGADDGAWDRALAALEATPDAVLHLASLDPVQDGGADQQRVLGTAFALVSALDRAGWSSTPRLHLATAGVLDVGDAAVTAEHGATLWGLGASLSLEQPALRCRRIDLDPAAPTDAVAVLATELACDDDEDALAWRGGGRHGLRLVPLPAPRGREISLPADRPWRLGVSRYGSLDQLAALPLEPRAPGPGEVALEVDAAALNFKDVLFALGLLVEHTGITDATAQPLGLECAGRITALGDGVSGLAVGDDVIVAAEGALASHVVAKVEGVVRRPVGLPASVAAGLPTVFLTVLHALEDRAKLAAGETVLVHAAAGGVGQAAIQVARRLGATVLATASAPKRGHLHGQGIEHVFDSRSLDFAEQVLAVTGGRGVDVVLDSLSGDAIGASLRCLADGGRLVEIGKRDVWTSERVAEQRPDVAYHLFDMADETAADPALLSGLMTRLVDGMADGSLTPPATRAWPASEARAAFAHLAAAANIGKLVLRLPSTRPAVRADRTYLVTGGAGALGRHVGRWLGSRGAGQVLLASRTAPTEDALADLREDGFPVDGASLDVTDLAAVSAFVDACDPPLGGVFHAAGVLDDGLISGMPWSRVAAVLAPKLTGTLVLEQATRACDLDHFVLFSSMSGLVGNAGQGSYAAANSFLDAVARRRRQQGLAGLSVAWGPWADGGMAERGGDALAERLASRGVWSLSAEQGLAVLATLLDGDPEPALGALPVRWSRWVSALPGPPPSLVADLLPRSDAAGAGATTGRDLAAEIAGLAGDELSDALLAHLRAELALVMGFASGDQVEADVPLLDLGLDSLLAVDLRNRLESELSLSLPATLVFDHPTLSALAEQLAILIAQGDGLSEEEQLLSEIENLTEEEARRLLAAGDEDD